MESNNTMKSVFRSLARISFVLVVMLGVAAAPALAQLTQVTPDPLQTTALEDGTLDEITQGELEYTSASANPDNVIYEITNDVTEGSIVIDDGAGQVFLGTGDTFSQADINNGFVSTSTTRC